MTDKGLSQSLGPGQIIPGLVVPAGGYLSFLVAGPPLGAIELLEELEVLQAAGLPPTRLALRKKPHLLGRLFAWIEWRRAAASLPEMRNSDGEPVVLGRDHESADDPELLHLSLAAMKDVDHSPDEDMFTWFRAVPRGSRSDLLQRTLLGRIGDESPLSRRRERRAGAAS